VGKIIYFSGRGIGPNNGPKISIKKGMKTENIPVPEILLVPLCPRCKAPIL